MAAPAPSPLHPPPARCVLIAGAMHQLLFSLKRAFRNSITFCERRLLAAHALTPSRFDIIYLLHRSQSGLEQHRLRRELGIASSTLSEILKGLEARGWIQRTRNDSDRRSFIVSLTERGLANADYVVQQVVFDGAALRALREALGGHRRGRPRAKAYELMERVQTALNGLEQWFGPRVACLRYPWYRPSDVWDPDEYA